MIYIRILGLERENIFDYDVGIIGLEIKKIFVIIKVLKCSKNKKNWKYFIKKIERKVKVRFVFIYD